MRRYIKADLRRVFRRIPRWILVAISWIIIIFTSVNGMETLSAAVESLASNFLVFNVVFGLIEIVFIYGDDFKAKTMQMAIGTGLPRQKVVHAKWLEFMIMTAFDLGVVTIVTLIASVICVGTNGGFDFGSMLIQLIIAWLAVNAYLGSLMFFMYWMQGISLTLILFLLDGCNLFPTALSTIGSLLKITRFHIQTYSLSSFIGTFEARLLMGVFSWSSFIGILIYMMGGFALASIIFKKKELEF